MAQDAQNNGVGRAKQRHGMLKITELFQGHIIAYLQIPVSILTNTIKNVDKLLRLRLGGIAKRRELSTFVLDSIL